MAGAPGPGVPGGSRVLRAASFAAALGGAPSTLWALARGDDVLAPTRAAGGLIAPGSRGARRLVAAAAAHGLLSLAWTAALAGALGRRSPVAGAAAGALAGVGVAALDLGAAHALRSHPRLGAVADLPLGPQVADHVAFGALAGWALSWTGPAPSSAPRGGR